MKQEVRNIYEDITEISAELYLHHQKIKEGELFLKNAGTESELREELKTVAKEIEELIKNAADIVEEIRRNEDR
jgi:hypothetical protein